jgi:16S rRNA processing protein RimM
VNNDYVAVGRLGRPYGVQGFLKIHSFTDPPENFLNYSPWFIFFQDKKLALIDCMSKGNFFIGKVQDCHSPEAAKKYVNASIMILRSQLPDIENTAHYLIDLLNFDVYNLKNEWLGKVESFIETGANHVLVIKDKEKEMLVPYVLDQFVQTVDKDARKIVVDWEKTW